MSLHRYSTRSLLADYARAALGVAITAVPLIVSGGFGIVASIVLALMAVFVVYGLRTALRHLTRIEVSDIGIRALGPIGRAITWDEVGDVRLRYYSTRRDRQKGWLQLKIQGPGGSIGMDSQLDDFETVLNAVMRAASARGIASDPTTLENLKLFEERRDSLA